MQGMGREAHLLSLWREGQCHNLRLTTQRENMNNAYKQRNGKLVGCSLDKRNNKWQAQIKINGKSIYLGLYKTEIEAHKIYIAVKNKIMKIARSEMNNSKNEKRCCCPSCGSDDLDEFVLTVRCCRCNKTSKKQDLVTERQARLLPRPLARRRQWR